MPRREVTEMSMSSEAAAEIGARALIFLAERPDEIAALLTESGADVEDLRAAADDPSALGFILAYIGRRAALAETFCAAENLTPEELATAEAALLGQETHWT